MKFCIGLNTLQLSNVNNFDILWCNKLYWPRHVLTRRRSLHDSLKTDAPHTPAHTAAGFSRRPNNATLRQVGIRRQHPVAPGPPVTDPFRRDQGAGGLRLGPSLLPKVTDGLRSPVPAEAGLRIINYTLHGHLIFKNRTHEQ